VKATSISRVYGESTPAFSIFLSVGTLASGDTLAALGTPIFTTSPTNPAVNVGSYTIAVSGLSNSNYAITYDNTGTLTITTAFAFNGFYSPIGGSVEDGNGGTFADPVRAFKLGSTVPVKFGATWLNGSGALITGVHKLQAFKYSSATGDPTEVIDATPTDAATTGNEFRLTATDWHFNLSTKGGFSVGTWLLIATLQDGSKHTVWIAIKK
jgi:hypothetical protein